MHEALKKLKSILILSLVGLILSACSLGGGDPDDEEGGVIGTGLILDGTVTDVRKFANNTLQIKARTGESSNAIFDDTGRYRAPSVKGEPPYLLRADLGNEEYRYGIAFDSQRANVHSYTDAVLRNWFESNNGDIDFEFDQSELSTTLPSRIQFQTNASEIFKLVDLVLASYELTGEMLLTGDYDSASNTNGIDQYLRSNPIVIQDEKISFVITDPETKTQSTTRSGYSLFELASEPDTESPEVPSSVRALPSASNEIAVVWDPSFDNRGVVAYEVFRDGDRIATTPYPVWIDIGVESGRLYSYEVLAVDGSNNTSASSLPATSGTLADIDTVAPPSPVQLTIQSKKGRMDLLWGQMNIADVVSFDVYRGRDNDPVEFLTSVTSSVMTDVSISSGVQYCYEVVALDASGNESEPSEAVCRTAEGNEITRVDDQVLPNVPALAGLTIPDVNAEECTLEWQDHEIDTAISVAQGCYEVSRDIDINNGGRLTLQPGVILKFGAGTGIEVNKGGSFTSDGTKTSPVVLTAEDPTPGYWDGVLFNSSNSARNKLVNTVVEYAGGGSASAAIALRSNSGQTTRVEVSTSVIRDCLGAGIKANSALETISRLDGSVITGCEIPIDTRIAGLDGVTQRNDFTGNTRDLIDLGKSTVASDKQLKDLGVPYVATDIRISSGNLTVLEGVELQFRAGGELSVSGSLTVAGSESRRVLFTGTIKERGHWSGIVTSGNTRLEYLDLEYGGHDYKNNTHYGSLLLLDSATLTLSDVSIGNSASYAINQTNESVSIKKAQNLAIVENAKTIRANISDIQDFNDRVEFSSNDSNAIILSAGTSYGGDINVYDLGVDYYLTETLFLDRGVLTIHPAVTILFDSNVGLFIANGASMSIVGTQQKPVLLTHESGMPGSWDGITISSDSSLNKVQYASILFAGSSSNGYSGAINMDCPGAKLTISDTTIGNSSGWGIDSKSSTNCGLSLGRNIQFNQNASGDISFEL